MAFSIRATAPVSCVTLRPAAPRARAVSVRAAAPKKDVSEAIADAKKDCDTGSTAECAAAWDVVEEISASNSHKAAKASENKEDPLEKYCETDPSADECRVYSD